MNWHHLSAFVWLRWRLLANQLHKGGILNKIIMTMAVIAAIPSTILLFAVAFGIGMFALSDVSPAVLMYIWDGIVVAFLTFWTIGLLAELQRSEALALDKFLHLPVSLTGVFVLNYLSSLLSFNLLLFLPGLAGLSLGLVFGRGPEMLLGLPLLASFLLMVTALTYQLQGWLAALMVNQRRRRTVVVLVTMVIILLAQLPNLINLLQPWKNFDSKDSGVSEQQVEDAAWIVNLCLPPGWLPLGAMGAASGDYLLPLLGTAGMTLIGTGSLWRAYRTTVRLYTGQFTAGTTEPVPVPPVQKDKLTEPAPANMLEKELPWLSEQAAVIALASFRSLTRAPEAKMMLLTPLIMLVVFGGMFFRGSVEMPLLVRPLLAFGAMAMIQLTLVQFVGNQFGFDRSGFRVYVLSPTHRREILLGKNLAIAPLSCLLTAPGVILIQVLYPMRIDYFLALVPQFVSMYLLFCMLANALSIISPLPIAHGTFKPANPKLTTILVQMLFIWTYPIALLPTLLPLGAALLLETFVWWLEGMPICLVLALIEAVLVVFLYRIVLTWEGAWLQTREQKILEIVTAKTE